MHRRVLQHALVGECRNAPRDTAGHRDDPVVIDDARQRREVGKDGLAISAHGGAELRGIARLTDGVLARSTRLFGRAGAAREHHRSGNDQEARGPKKRVHSPNQAHDMPHVAHEGSPAFLEFSAGDLNSQTQSQVDSRDGRRANAHAALTSWGPAYFSECGLHVTCTALGKDPCDLQRAEREGAVSGHLKRVDGDHVPRRRSLDSIANVGFQVVAIATHDGDGEERVGHVSCAPISRSRRLRDRPSSWSGSDVARCKRRHRSVSQVH